MSNSIQDIRNLSIDELCLELDHFDVLSAGQANNMARIASIGAIDEKEFKQHRRWELGLKRWFNEAIKKRAEGGQRELELEWKDVKLAPNFEDLVIEIGSDKTILANVFAKEENFRRLIAKWLEQNGYEVLYFGSTFIVRW